MRKIILIMLCLCVVLTACEKNEADKKEDTLTGKWNLTAYRLKVTDVNGAVRSETSSSNPGSAEFIKGSGDNGDVFNTINAEGQFSNAVFIEYFKRLGTGSRTGTGGWQFYWDADPDNERILFWAVGASVSYHRVVNIAHSGKNQLIMTFIEEDATAKTRSFYTWDFSR